MPYKKTPAPPKPPRKYNPGAESNGVWNTPALTSAVSETEASGRMPGGRTGSQFLGGVYGRITAPTAPMPLPSGPRGAGDGGAAARQQAAAENAIRVLFSQYNRAPDMSLDQDIDRQVGEAQGTASNSLARLTALLSSQQNPYQNTVQAATTAVNPLVEYMQQTGASTAGVDALRSMLEAGNADLAAAGQNMNDRQSQSWQNAQQSRQADAGFQSQQFQQALASNAATTKTNLTAQRQKDKDAMMQQILQYAISNGIDLGKLGITF